MTENEASFILANIDRRVCDDELSEALDMAIKALEQTRWIPVSERLPESSGVYIVSRWFSDGCESKILTTVSYYDGTNTWHNDIGINHSREYVNKKIVAWMPLPEPYKAETKIEQGLSFGDQDTMMPAT